MKNDGNTSRVLPETISRSEINYSCQACKHFFQPPITAVSPCDWRVWVFQWRCPSRHRNSWLHGFFGIRTPPRKGLTGGLHRSQRVKLLPRDLEHPKTLQGKHAEIHGLMNENYFYTDSDHPSKMKVLKTFIYLSAFYSIPPFNLFLSNSMLNPFILNNLRILRIQSQIWVATQWLMRACCSSTPGVSTQNPNSSWTLQRTSDELTMDGRDPPQAPLLATSRPILCPGPEKINGSTKQGAGDIELSPQNGQLKLRVESFHRNLGVRHGNFNSQHSQTPNLCNSWI